MNKVKATFGGSGWLGNWGNLYPWGRSTLPGGWPPMWFGIPKV